MWTKVAVDNFFPFNCNLLISFYGKVTYYIYSVT